MSQKPAKALAYALLIWFVGFAWGTVVFMTPALKNISSIPYVSRYPAISFPILIIWRLIGYVLARSYLRTLTNAAGERFRLGVILAAVNLVLDLLILVLLFKTVLDLLILVLLFKTGFGYFASLTVWLAYFVLLIVPWLVGRSLANRG